MSMVIGGVTWASNLTCTWILNWFMFSTNCVTRLAVFSFEIVPVWKLSFTKVTLADRLRGLLRLISLNCPLGHQTSIFTCPRSKFSCPGNCAWVFSCFALNAKGHTLCAWPFWCDVPACFAPGTIETLMQRSTNVTRWQFSLQNS